MGGRGNGGRGNGVKGEMWFKPDGYCLWFALSAVAQAKMQTARKISSTFSNMRQKA